MSFRQIGVCLLLTLAAFTHAQIGNEIAWRADYATALAEAKRTHGVMFVEFFEPDDGFSQHLHTYTFTNHKVFEPIRKMIPVRLNAQQIGIAQIAKFKVGGVPTVLLLDENEEEVGRIAGFQKPDEFVDQMMKAYNAYIDLPVAKKALAKDPKNVQSLSRLGTIYADRGELELANDYLARAVKVDPKNSSGLIGDLYNSVGDAYQLAEMFNDAITHFENAAKLGKTPKTIAYAKMSIGACYISLEQYDKARAVLEELLKMPNLPAKEKADTEDMLKDLPKPPPF